MRIGINARSMTHQRLTGIGRYTSHLVRSLSELDHDNEYILYVKKKLFSRRTRLPTIRAKNVSMAVDWCDRGVAKTLKRLDVYHAPSFDFLTLAGPRIVVTVQDLVYKAYPQGHTLETIETTARQVGDIVRRASRIICPSESTRHDLLRYVPIEGERVCVIPLGVDPRTFYRLGPPERLQTASVLRAKGLATPFLLFVGTLEPRKNLHTLLRAMALLKEHKEFSGPLAVAGMTGWKTEGVAELITALGLTDRVVTLGYVSDNELRALYNLAEVFVFPSYYEGFGLPIVEAFACGAAVVTSNASSCPEVAQEAALVVDPNRPEQLAGAIASVVNDQGLRRTLQEKAVQRAQLCSWARTAHSTLEVYEQVHRGTLGDGHRITGNR